MIAIYFQVPRRVDMPCGFCGIRLLDTEGVYGDDALRSCEACGQRQRGPALNDEKKYAETARRGFPPCAWTEYKTL